MELCQGIYILVAKQIVFNVSIKNIIVFPGGKVPEPKYI